MTQSFWEIFFASQAFLLLAMGFVLGVFDKLIEALIRLIHTFQFASQVDQFEKGVFLRWGKYKRTVGPGLRFHFPWGIEKLVKETVVRQTAYLDVQSLTTHDGKRVTIAGIVIFKIEDIKKFLLQIDEGETDVMNMVYGVISDCVEAHDWEYVITSAFNKQVLHKVRLATENYCGVRVISIKW